MTETHPPQYSFPKNGEQVSLAQAQELVYQTTVLAKQSGCIPIASAILQKTSSSGLYTLRGYGHNELGWGRPFVHGETGAFQSAGNIDYRDTVLLSSLSPCEFCQGCAAHLGAKEVLYLDALNFVPDQESFSRFDIAHSETRHELCCQHFATWLVEDASLEGRNLWHQDIGSYKADDPIEIDFDKLMPALEQVIGLMRYALSLGEYPCGTVIVNSETYQIMAYGPGSIVRTNDPTAVPEVFAGRQCSARTRWDRAIFVSSSAPSPIANGMFKRWAVRNLVVITPETFGVPTGLRVDYAPIDVQNRAQKIVSEWKASIDSQDFDRLQRLYGGVL
jgi:cytosine deaminase